MLFQEDRTDLGCCSSWLSLKIALHVETHVRIVVAVTRMLAVVVEESKLNLLWIPWGAVSGTADIAAVVSGKHGDAPTWMIGVVERR